MYIKDKVLNKQIYKKNRETKETLEYLFIKLLQELLDYFTPNNSSCKVGCRNASCMTFCSFTDGKSGSSCLLLGESNLALIGSLYVFSLFSDDEFNVTV